MERKMTLSYHLGHCLNVPSSKTFPDTQTVFSVTLDMTFLCFISLVPQVNMWNDLLVFAFHCLSLPSDDNCTGVTLFSAVLIMPLEPRRGPDAHRCTITE
jgi:hypothetical protein